MTEVWETLHNGAFVACIQLESAMCFSTRKLKRIVQSTAHIKLDTANVQSQQDKKNSEGRW
jgi:hypothetical protein